MNDDLRFNLSNKYEFTDFYLFDFYSDAVMESENPTNFSAKGIDYLLDFGGYEQYNYGDVVYTSYYFTGDVSEKIFNGDVSEITNPNVILNITNLQYDIANENLKTISFLNIIPSINSINNKDINNEYILNYELILKTGNGSWFPFVHNSEYDNIRYSTEDSLVLRDRFKLLDYIQLYESQVYFIKKTIETLDLTTQIIINNDGSFIKINDENLQPIKQDNGFIEYVAPIDLGNNFNYLHVEELYYIRNNQKLYPTKYSNSFELNKFASNTNDTFAGYTIEESDNNKYLISKFIDEGPDESFKFHYVLTGSVEDTFITNSKDVFTKNVHFDSAIKIQSPNTLYTIKVEIPEGYYIEENSINRKDLLLPGSKLNDQSVIWQFKLDELDNLEPYVPFGFSYSKNEKEIALKLLYFNLIFMIIILIFYFSNIFKKKTHETIFSSALFLFTNILLPFYFGWSEFVNIFIYSKAYLPILLIGILFVHHLYENNKISE